MNGFLMAFHYEFIPFIDFTIRSRILERQSAKPILISRSKMPTHRDGFSVGSLAPALILRQLSLFNFHHYPDNMARLMACLIDILWCPMLRPVRLPFHVTGSSLTASVRFREEIVYEYDLICVRKLRRCLIHES